MPIKEMPRYSREYIRSHPDWLFAFGDNLTGRGYGGQAKEARGEPNAVGIPTKRRPSMEADAFFCDDDLAMVGHQWWRAFHRINQHLLAGGIVVWPTYGVGTGRAQLEKRAPRLWNELQLFIAAMKSVEAALKRP